MVVLVVLVLVVVSSQLSKCAYKGGYFTKLIRGRLQEVILYLGPKIFYEQQNETRRNAKVVFVEPSQFLIDFCSIFEFQMIKNSFSRQWQPIETSGPGPCPGRRRDREFIVSSQLSNCAYRG